MRYSILKPASPTDPRHLVFGSQDELYAQLPRILECENEDETVLAIRSVYPDGLGMPIPLKMGSGVISLLGIISDIHQPHDGGAAIPFVMFVQPHPLNGADRRVLFDRKKWALRPKTPIVHDGVQPRTYQAELRSPELEQGVIIPLIVSRTEEGRLLLYAPVGDTQFSIELLDDKVALY